MRNSRSAVLAVAAMVAAATPSAASAQGIDYGSDTDIPTPVPRPGWRLGLGFAAVPDYEGSSDYRAVPVPYIHWQGENRYFDLTGLTAKANLLNSSVIEFGPRLRVRPAREDVKNNRVDRLQSTDTAVELGGFVGLNLGPWNAEVWVTQDVADAYDGQLAGFDGGYTWPVDQDWTLGVGASTTYASGKYMETYFGVDAANAQRSGLREYDAGRGFKDVGANLNATYNGWEHWQLSGLLSYKRLVGDAEDSPITKEGSANQFVGGVILIYRFTGPT
jgi:MipA family protein